MSLQNAAVFAALVVAPLCAAQEWEIGVMGGYGGLNPKTETAS